METRLRTGSCFYSTCLSPELHLILPNLINSTPGSSVNFHLVDIFTKSCISQIISFTFLTQRHTEFHFLSLREVGTKERLWHFVIAEQYAATKTDSFSNIQIRKICFQKYNITCKGARITRGPLLGRWPVQSILPSRHLYQPGYPLAKASVSGVESLRSSQLLFRSKGRYRLMF